MIIMIITNHENRIAANAAPLKGPSFPADQAPPASNFAREPWDHAPLKARCSGG